MAVERIDKLLSSISSYSRTDIKKMAKYNKIIVNGKVVHDCSFKVDCESDEIVFDGEKLEVKKHIYIMLNKPKGVVSASCGKGETTVVDLVHEKLKRNGLFPAGRLDKDTTGFVLITDDGEFAHRILTPKNHIQKTYITTLKKPISEKDISILSEGLTLKDGTIFKPAIIEPLDEECLRVKVVICEGKYHQIKRMFKAVENEVLELERIKMGSLFLDKSLDLGECREITPKEIELILN